MFEDLLFYNLDCLKFILKNCFTFSDNGYISCHVILDRHIHTFKFRPFQVSTLRWVCWVCCRSDALLKEPKMGNEAIPTIR